MSESDHVNFIESCKQSDAFVISVCLVSSLDIFILGV